MRGSRLVRALVGIAAVIAAFCLTYRLADALTVCQIGNGCTGTSTAPAWGQILIGGQNGEYEFVASTTFSGFAPVQSVFGRTGAVIAQTGDYTTSQVTEGSNLYFTPARAVTALTGQSNTLFTNGSGYVASNTPWLVGQLAEITDSGHIAGVATSTLTAGNGLTGSFTHVGTTGSIALSAPVSIANGGTNEGTQTTNGVSYFDGAGITSGSNLTYDGTTLAVLASGSSNGSVKISPASGGYVFAINGPNLTNNISQIQFSSSGLRTFQISNPGSGGLITVFGNTARTNTGTGLNFVGINGTSTPGGLLSVAGSAGGTTPLLLISSSTSGSATTTVLEADSNGNIELQGANPTSALTLSNVASPSGITLFNTSDQTTNYEKGVISFQNNILDIATQFGGTGTQRSVQLDASAGGAVLKVTRATLPLFSFTHTSGTSGGNYAAFNCVFGGTASVTQVCLMVNPTISESGSAGYTAFKIAPTEASLGSGPHLLSQIGTSSAPDLFDIANTGNTAIATTTLTGILNLGTYGSANGTSTVEAGKIQIDGYNSAGSRICMYVVGTALTISSGACNP